MALSPGTSLGPYEIESPLGAGGMGEVYKARDTRLDRTVAIKVLPEHVAADPDLKARFEREAKTVAALSHPHICPVFDVGEQDGVNYLVMEYLDGETLAQRLEKGALPLDQALQVAIEIADALDKAHRQGIVHRDLKPGNIMLTKAGAKLLDFGLAKPTGMALGTDSAMPTMSEGLTGQGAILGTLRYMAPEQLEGDDVDARTDIFAFGTTVYEMITGQETFSGKSQASLIGSILKDDPRPMTTLDPMSPPALDRVVRKCLAKAPEARWHSAHDLHDELQWVAEGGQPVEAPPSTSSTAATAGRRRTPMVALGALVVGALLSGLTVWTLKPEPPRPVTRWVVSVPPSAPLVSAGSMNDVAISPDGTRVVYRTAAPGGTPQLDVRMLDQIAASPLRGPAAALNPFMSPDGAWIGFASGAGGSLQKVSTLGGPPVTICALPAALRGASWGADDVIVFGTNSASGLLRVPAAGGEPEAITVAENGRHHWPDVLPGGAGVLFTISTGPGSADNQVALLDLATGEHDVIIPSGSHPRYTPTGHIVYGVDGTLRAVTFDLDSLEVTGDPVPVVEGVLIKGTGAASFDISQTGSLVYVSGEAGTGGEMRTFAWMDRDGNEQPIGLAPDAYGWGRVSPDGTRVVFDLQDQGGFDVWVSDLTRPGARSKVTTSPEADGFPVWTPDGDQVVFQSMRNGQPELFQKSADGTGQAESLLTVEGATFLFPYEWTPDGQMLLVAHATAETAQDFGVLSLEGDPTWRPLLETAAAEGNPALSPDGEWIAYRSDETGQTEVYVARFPTMEGRQPVSLGGGWAPAFSPDGSELFYRTVGGLMSVPVTLGPSIELGTPEVVFEGDFRGVPGQSRYYEVGADGRLLMQRTGDTIDDETLTQVVLVQNWLDELQRLVPTGQ